jgi:hypothetical protein
MLPFLTAVTRPKQPGWKEHSEDRLQAGQQRGPEPEGGGEDPAEDHGLLHAVPRAHRAVHPEAGRRLPRGRGALHLVRPGGTYYAVLYCTYCFDIHTYTHACVYMYARIMAVACIYSTI